MALEQLTSKRSGWRLEVAGRWQRLLRHPARLVLLSFVAVIGAGTVLLSLPWASAHGRSIGFVDALFTAASATCVTGLVTLDTGADFSLFGQLVILACIQIGGLGLMTFTTLFAVALGNRMGIAGRVALQESFHHSATGNVKRLIVHVVLATLAAEFAGAVALASWWLYRGSPFSVSYTLYSAAFHSISAFCNAGFSLYSDSLIRFQTDWFTLWVFSGLIILGGIGFLVSLDVREYVVRRLRRSGRPLQRPRLSLHTKFVLAVTTILLAVGTVSYYFLERDGLLARLALEDAWLNAWFCSVTARTAGFNTLDYGLMSAPALLCTMVLMFIGASPGSTGGGVKTSTFGLLVAHALFRWRGHAGPHAFGRSIPEETINRAGSVLMAAVAVVIVAGSFVMALETRAGHPLQSQAGFAPVLFETISAFGTVGLSMGITTKLTATTKLLLSLVMLIGRVGPLTLALGMIMARRDTLYRYAEENVMVG
jgi:trk system potassium uptake protein